jgi:hypothetical protein
MCVNNWDPWNDYEHAQELQMLRRQRLRSVSADPWNDYEHVHEVWAVGCV